MFNYLLTIAFFPISTHQNENEYLMILYEKLSVHKIIWIWIFGYRKIICE